MRLAQIVRHAACAGAAGLALGGALGLTEIALGAGGARSGGLAPEEALQATLEEWRAFWHDGAPRNLGVVTDSSRLP